MQGKEKIGKVKTCGVGDLHGKRGEHAPTPREPVW